MLTEDGQPARPLIYEDIVKQRYVISNHTNVSYQDSGNMTPLERKYLLKFIQEDLERQQKQYDEAQKNKK